MTDNNESLFDVMKCTAKTVEGISKWMGITNENINILGDTMRMMLERIERLEDSNIKTNADRVRHMSDEELLETIYQHMGNAAACPDCFRKNGKERLQMWLEMENKED